MHPSDRTLLIIREVIAATRLSKPTIYKRMSVGLFPRPIRIGENRVAWLKREIDDWIDNQALSR